MKTNLKKEHIAGSYQIKAALIAGFCAFIPLFFTNAGSETKFNSFEARDLFNSPVNINNGNQNIYNGQVINLTNDSTIKPTLKKVEPQMPVKKSTDEDELPKATIINDGNLSINNKGTIHQNYYNNTPVAVQRTLTEEDLLKIESIPKDYTIELVYSERNKECEKFGKELERAFKVLKYNVIIDPYILNVSSFYDERFSITQGSKPNSLKVTVHVLQ